MAFPTPEEIAADPRPRVRASFSLVGDELNLGRCNAEIGVPPTDWGRKGEIRANRRCPIPETFWKIMLDRCTWELEEVVAELLDIVTPHQQAIQRIRREGVISAEINCVVELYRDSVVLALSEESIKRMAALGLAFGLELYDYREDEDPPGW